MCDIDLDAVSDDLGAELTDQCPRPVSSDLNASDTGDIAKPDDDYSSDTGLCCRSTNPVQDVVDDDAACVLGHCPEHSDSPACYLPAEARLG